MPTVLRLGGLRVLIYPSDHRPAHVHVIGAGCEAVFNLNCPDGPLVLRESFRFAARDLNVVEAALGRALAQLCEDWRRMHGDHG